MAPMIGDVRVQIMNRSPGQEPRVGATFVERVLAVAQVLRRASDGRGVVEHVDVIVRPALPSDVVYDDDFVELDLVAAPDDGPMASILEKPIEITTDATVGEAIPIRLASPYNLLVADPPSYRWPLRMTFLLTHGRRSVSPKTTVGWESAR